MFCPCSGRPEAPRKGLRKHGKSCPCLYKPLPPQLPVPAQGGHHFGAVCLSKRKPSELGITHDAHVTPIHPWAVQLHANHALGSPPAHHGTCTVGGGLARRLPAARWDERTGPLGRQEASTRATGEFVSRSQCSNIHTNLRARSQCYGFARLQTD